MWLYSYIITHTTPKGMVMALLFATRQESLWSWNEGDTTENMRLRLSLSMDGVLYFNGANAADYARTHMTNPLFILDIDTSDPERVDGLIFDVASEYYESLSVLRRLFCRKRSTNLEALVRKQFIFVIKPITERWVDATGQLIKSRPVTVMPLQKRRGLYRRCDGLSSWFMIGVCRPNGKRKWDIETLQSVVALHPAKARPLI